MINFVPKTYKNELLISILKRYHMQSANSSQAASLVELFDTHMTSIHTHVPTNLNTLCSNIPKEFNITSDYLIDNHTLFYYFTAFIRSERKNEIRQRMKQDKGDAYKITKYGEIQTNQTLRYCPLCVKEQREEKGEFSWNRLHQVTFLCTKHKIRLLDSPYKVGGKDLDYYVPDYGVIYIDKKAMDFEKLLRISNRIEDLVKNSSDFSHEELRIVYFAELDKRGFLYNSKAQVYLTRLETELKEYFGKEILIEVIKSNEIGWVRRLLHNYTVEIHPLFHILMQEYLDLNNEKIDSILGDFNKLKDRLIEQGADLEGVNHWEFEYLEQLFKLSITCKNPLASHKGVKNIKDIRLHYCYKSEEFMCTFRCGCGFIYTTLYSDVLASDGQKIGKIKEWGDVYFRELSKLKHLGNKGVARLTGINVGTVRKQFAKLKEGSVKQMPEELNAKRKIDNRTRPNNEKTWARKDDLYYEKVKELLVRELDTEGRPVRITKTYIAKQVGGTSAIMYNLDKMPRTKEIIGKNVMSREEWKMNL